VALEELLWGPPAISQVGFGTAIPTPEEVLRAPVDYPGPYEGWGSRVALRGLKVAAGVATADFSPELIPRGGDSLRARLIRDQITHTLMQFPGISEVRITVQGHTVDFPEP
jgi:spore germination protein GerM